MTAAPIHALQAVLALLARDLRAVRRSRSQVYSSILFPLMLLALLLVVIGLRRGPAAV